MSLFAARVRIKVLSKFRVDKTDVWDVIVEQIIKVILSQHWYAAHLQCRDLKIRNQVGSPQISTKVQLESGSLLRLECYEWAIKYDCCIIRMLKIPSRPIYVYIWYILFMIIFDAKTNYCQTDLMVMEEAFFD